MEERLHIIDKKIEGLRTDVDHIKKYGVDFKIEVHNGEGVRKIKLSEITATLYAYTSALREHTPQQQHEIFKGTMDFYRFVSFVTKHRILLVIGSIGVLTTLKLLLDVLENIDILQLLK